MWELQIALIGFREMSRQWDLHWYFLTLTTNNISHQISPSSYQHAQSYDWQNHTHAQKKKKEFAGEICLMFIFVPLFMSSKQDLQMRGKTEVAALWIYISSKDHLYPQFQKRSVRMMMSDCSNFGWTARDSSDLSGTRLWRQAQSQCKQKVKLALFLCCFSRLSEMRIWKRVWQERWTERTRAKLLLGVEGEDMSRSD